MTDQVGIIQDFSYPAKSFSFIIHQLVPRPYEKCASKPFEVNCLVVFGAMKLLKEIYRNDNLNLGGRTLVRESARAIILRGHELLLVYASLEGGYKFPGGGVEPGETHDETLAREIQEECGARLSQILREYGMVIEYKLPFEPEFDVFKMISRYYVCQVTECLVEPRLDDYERQLGYCPQWVPVQDAIHANHRLSSLAGGDVPGWIVRETYILNLIGDQLEG
jgi:8-oxo-dGTP diphosphatase